MKNRSDPDKLLPAEEYTFEDYTKDFELDYLGFDGVPDEPVTDIPSEKNPENGPEPDAERCARQDGSASEEKE